MKALAPSRELVSVELAIEHERDPVLHRFRGRGRTSLPSFTTPGPWELRFSSATWMAITGLDRPVELPGGAGSVAVDHCGSFHLQVAATGDWMITVVQPGELPTHRYTAKLRSRWHNPFAFPVTVTLAGTDATTSRELEPGETTSIDDVVFLGRFPIALSKTAQAEQIAAITPPRLESLTRTRSIGNPPNERRDKATKLFWIGGTSLGTGLALLTYGAAQPQLPRTFAVGLTLGSIGIVSGIALLLTGNKLRRLASRLALLPSSTGASLSGSF